MAHLGADQCLVRFRLSGRDAASLRKIAKAAQLSMSDVVRLLIRRERAATTKLAKTVAA